MLLIATLCKRQKPSQIARDTIRKTLYNPCVTGCNPKEPSPEQGKGLKQQRREHVYLLFGSPADDTYWCMLRSWAPSGSKPSSTGQAHGHSMRQGRLLYANVLITSSPGNNISWTPSGSPQEPYSGGARFEYRPGHQLPWVRFFVSWFPQPLPANVTRAPRLGHDSFLQNPSQFISHPNHSAIYSLS
jgi:hypothetical protein